MGCAPVSTARLLSRQMVSTDQGPYAAAAAAQERGITHPHPLTQVVREGPVVEALLGKKRQLPEP